MQEGRSIEAAPVRYRYACLAAAVSLAIYAGSLWGGFVYDDNSLITYNETIKDLSNIPSLFMADLSVSVGGSKANYYRPFMFLVFMADYHIFGLDPWGFHLSYIILHALVTMGVFLLTSMIIGDARGGGRGKAYPLVPLGAALLFATHPIHTQVVAWNGAHEMGMALFVLLALYFYVQGRHMTGALCFLLSAFFKETAMVFPAVLIAWDAAFNKGFLLPPTREKLISVAKRYLPYLSVAVIYMGLRTYALGGFTNINHHEDLTFYEYLINVPPLFAKYMWKLLLPTGLSAAHTFNPVHSLLEWRSVAALAVFGVYLAALGYQYRSRGAVFFLMIFMVLPLLPVFYIPGLGVHVFAENYLYLPGVAFALLSALLAHRLFGKLRAGDFGKGAPPGLALALVATVILVYAVGTVKRVPVWRTNMALWSDVVLKSPDNYFAHNNLGIELYRAGRVEEAVGEFERTLAIKTDSVKAYTNLGKIYFEKGMNGKAASMYREAIGLGGAGKSPHASLGFALLRLAREGEAERHFKEALLLDERYGKAHYGLALAYYGQGMLREAAGEFKMALSIGLSMALPNDETNADAHYHLASIYHDMGLMEEAIAQYRAAVALSPSNLGARTNLAVAYGATGRLEEAVAELEGVVRLDPSLTDAHYNLAVAYKKAGRAEEAAKEILKTLGLDPAYPVPADMAPLLGAGTVGAGAVDAGAVDNNGE